MRVLVTGAGGFVGRHALEILPEVLGNRADIVFTSSRPDRSLGIKRLDLLDYDSVERLLNEYRPTHILNLVGIASPVVATRYPDLTWQIHSDVPRRLAIMLNGINPRATLVNVGSGLIYGETFSSGHCLDESALVVPTDDYMASKFAGDVALQTLGRRGVRSVCMRPFSHAGPGQSEAFFLSGIAAQIARIEAGHIPPTMVVGNLDGERDYLDVRDVVRAYGLVIVKSDDIDPGTVINVASGNVHKVGDLLNRMLSMSPVNIEIKIDPSRSRPMDIKRLCGNARRAYSLLGWAPTISMHDLLLAVLEYWRKRVCA